LKRLAKHGSRLLFESTYIRFQITGAHYRGKVSPGNETAQREQQSILDTNIFKNAKYVYSFKLLMHDFWYKAFENCNGCPSTTTLYKSEIYMGKDYKMTTAI
jgi:hypothetical protein